MIKNAIAIEKDIYQTVKVVLKDEIDGDVYREDCRPIDSALEDAVVSVSVATANQVQQGSAYVNVYTRDVQNGAKRFVPNKARLEEIAELDEQILEELQDTYVGEYEFALGASTKTIAEPDIRQHRVSINLSFRRITY